MGCNYRQRGVLAFGMLSFIDTSTRHGGTPARDRTLPGEQCTHTVRHTHVGTYTRWDIHMERTYTRRVIRARWDIYTEETYTWRGHHTLWG